MKSWYQNRMESGVTHRGQSIPKGKKVLLTEAQAKLHNSKQEKVAKLDKPPTDSKEVGVLADWIEYEKSLKADGRGLGGSPHERPVQEANQSETTKKSETTETKGKSSLKAKS